mmetsp:Transcript_16303/g.36774  ORF Transcript_16303/g.36774 Transcript_16303/m.36774 type:complete len:132 (-) Transcript_16303:54-449(-)
MARGRSSLSVVVLAVVALGLVSCLWRSPTQLPTFLPSPAAAARVAARPGVAAGEAAAAAVLVAASTVPIPAQALEGDDEEGFDLRILAVLALPLGAITWALFNVWRVAFRQVVRIGESASGSSKPGLSAED